jgi:hypothetical protein
MSFENVIVKNTNINRELRHQTDILENVFRANYKEFERLWYPISFDITAVASKTALEQVGIKHSFPFSYLAKAIAVLNQTNSLAGVAIEINGQLHPAEGFTVATTTSTATKNAVYRGNATVASVYPFEKFINRPFELQLHYINTHGSNQTVYLALLGYRIPEQQTLLKIKKGAVRY